MMNPFKSFLALLKRQDPARYRELLRDPRFQANRREAAREAREKAHARACQQASDRKRRLVAEGRGSHTLQGVES